MTDLPPRLERLVADWTTWMRTERRFSPLSIEAYGRDLAQFFEFVQRYGGTGLDLAHLARVDRLALRSWMAEQRAAGKSGDSVGRNLSALKSFYAFAAKQGLLDNTAVPAQRGPKRAQTIPKALREPEADTLLDALATDARGDWVAARDYAALLLMYGGGMRIAEVLSLNTDALQAMKAGALQFILGALQPSSAIDALLPVRGKLSTFPLWRSDATHAA